MQSPGSGDPVSTVLFLNLSSAYQAKLTVCPRGANLSCTAPSTPKKTMSILHCFPAICKKTLTTRKPGNAREQSPRELPESFGGCLLFSLAQNSIARRDTGTNRRFAGTSTLTFPELGRVVELSQSPLPDATGLNGSERAVNGRSGGKKTNRITFRTNLVLHRTARSTSYE